MQKITPFLWFDNNLEEAINFYSSVFKNTGIGNIVRTKSDGPFGPVVTATFELEGQKFMALNGGPHYKFNPAFSLFVNCENQEEVDELWAKLSEGGEKGRCGWVTDKFGLSWQIVPEVLTELLYDPDPVKSKNVMDAMLKMDKLDIQLLRDAHKE